MLQCEEKFESLIPILTPGSFSSLLFIKADSPILAILTLVSVGYHVIVFEPLEQLVLN